MSYSLALAFLLGAIVGFIVGRVTCRPARLTPREPMEYSPVPTDAMLRSIVYAANDTIISKRPEPDT